MEKPVVVLYDNVANSYKDPFYPPTKGVALREFQDAVNNPQNAQLHNHASDFDLYVIGTWDEQTGKLVCFDIPEKLANCSSLKLENANGNDAQESERRCAPIFNDTEGGNPSVKV